MTLQRLLTDPAMAGTWTCEPEGSAVRFVNQTLWGLIPVKGRFTDFTGEALISDGRLSGRLVVRADSVRTGIGMRDRHLRGPDFFDVADHPEIVVEVTGSAAGDLATNLTVRGTTFAVPLTTTATRRDDDSFTVAARGRIDRTRWGVSGNMLGMMPSTTVLMVDAAFNRTQSNTG